jgi:citrate lyase subunit beta/citryl-CoA lyase
MTPRSWLFVPGDRPERFAKAIASGADAIILDLEDAVSAARKGEARDAVKAFLTDRPAAPVVAVRINPLGSAEIEADLAALAGSRPDVLVMPKAEGAATIEALDGRLAAHGLAAIPLLPIATETPAAVFQLGTYAECGERLAGLTWGAEDLPAAIGAETSRDDQGNLTQPYEIVRAFALFAAAAAGVPAIETVYPAFADAEGTRRQAERAARDGFAGILAIHPSQVAAINAAFTPSAERIAFARKVIEAFEREPDAGALQIDGRMVDAPHLAQARRILDRASADQRTVKRT